MGNPLTGTFANSEDCIMLHFIRSTLFVKIKKIFRKKNTLFFENYYLTPLDMYNGLSQVYCMKPEGIIYKYTKGQGLEGLLGMYGHHCKKT